MIETITIISLCLLYIIFFRPGKTPPLDNPLVIERPGKYHVTLAPQLNLAQPFIEAIAKQISSPLEVKQHSLTQCFEVHDKNATAHGHKFYLLAITLRNGMLFFQAISPNPLTHDQDNNFTTLMAFANTVMDRFPASDLHNNVLDEQIINAVNIASQQHHIEINMLFDHTNQTSENAGHPAG